MSARTKWYARPTSGTHYVSDCDGAAIVSGPLHKGLAEVIALIPDMVAVIQDFAGCARSIEVDEDGYFEFDVPGQLRTELEMVADRLEEVLSPAGTNGAQPKKATRGQSAR